MEEKIKGIVIGSIDYKEKSKIVYLYTPNGKESILAGGAKSIKGGMLGFTNTLNYVEYVKTTSKLPKLVEYNIIESYYDLSSSLDKMRIISIIIQVINNINDITFHSSIFNFLIFILNELKKENANNKLILSVFLAKMLSAFGAQPSFNTCVRCNMKNLPAFLSIEEGGMVCNICSPISNLESYNIIKKIYQTKSQNIDDFEIKCDLDDLLVSLYKYYQFHVNINLKKY
jgi:DNA repair protein RecO (recombination protein O)